MKKNLKGQAKGFTIIEVVIVLAIASLILLIVFLAVPSLQRGQRNNARKSDSSRVAAAVVEFTTNNPTAALPTTVSDCTTLVTSTGTLGQYSFSNPCTGTNVVGAMPASVSAGTLYIATSATASSAPTAVSNVMILAEGVTCSGTSAVSAGNAKQTALLYTIESGSTWTWACVNPQ